MKKNIPRASHIQDNEKLDPEVTAALVGVAEDAISELKKALHRGCEVVTLIENFTSHPLTILRQSEKANNGHFVEAPEPNIGEKSIGLCSSEGGTGVGNKNYILYQLDTIEILIYWHSARIGGKTYWMDAHDGEKYKDKSDKKILNIGKDHQTQRTLNKHHGGYVVISTFGTGVIKISLMTKDQAG